MEIPNNVLKRLAADFRDWAFIRNPSDTDFWTGIDDNGGCWDFEIDADPYVRMEDGAPEPDYPVVADVNVYSVTAEYYRGEEATPLDGKAVAGSIDALCRARRIVVIGNGNSGAIALDAQHKLLRIGLNVSAYTDEHMQMIAVVSMTKDDVLIAISHSGSSRDVAEAMQVAKENGATVISITNNGISPVSKLADIRLYTYSQETKYRTYAISSRMAELTIIDTLYTGVSLRLGDKAIQNFEALEKALVVKKY